MGAFFRLENGRKLTYRGNNWHLINLTQTLSLIKLDQLSTIDLCGVDLDDYNLLTRFSQLKVLKVKIFQGSFATKDLLTLVEMAKEKKMLELQMHQEQDDKKLFQLILTGNGELIFGAASSMYPKDDFKQVLDHLNSFSFWRVMISYAGTIFDEVMKLVSEMKNLKVLWLDFDRLSVAKKAAVLKFGAARALELCETFHFKTCCRLQDCNSLLIDEESLQPADLVVLLQSLPTIPLRKLTLKVRQGDIQQCLDQALSQFRSLQYLSVANGSLRGFPKLSNPELETLILDDYCGPAHQVEELSDDDLKSIFALPKLKYLQVAWKTNARCDLYNFLKEGCPHFRVLVLKDKIKAIGDVTGEEIRKAFFTSYKYCLPVFFD